MNDDEPVYIKNYINPHSQKEEVEKQQKLMNDKIEEPLVSEYNIINCPEKIITKSRYTLLRHLQIPKLQIYLLN